ncbi:MAG TPA: hypothetical protein DDY78_02205, partial [Planctomycetales bacterium]|nr:hypothetical protein [Planctomycetales bacterium]
MRKASLISTPFLVLKLLFGNEVNNHKLGDFSEMKAVSTAEDANGKQSRRNCIPRWMAFLLGLIVALVVYPLMVGVLPWAISLLLPRYGWTENGPATWNLLGLIPVVVGIAGLIWVFSVMLAQIFKLPKTVKLEWTSRILVTHGPFAFSRNPMFLAGFTVWLGWALFFGSVVILIVSVLLWAVTDRLTVSREERALEARFGETYRAYKTRVPR